MKFRGASRLDIELYYLRENIASGDYELGCMAEDAYQSRACCPGCMFGSRYNDLADKQTRRKEWEQVLLKRKNKFTPPSDKD